MEKTEENITMTFTSDITSTNGNNGVEIDLTDLDSFLTFEEVEELPQIVCPHCGKSHYAIRYSTATCLYVQPVYCGDRRVDNDPNTYTDYCTCLDCGKEFIVRTCRSKKTVESVE